MTETILFEAGENLAGRYHLERPLLSAGETTPVQGIDYLARDSVDLRGRVLTQLTLPEDADDRRNFLNTFYAEAERFSGLVDPRLPLYSEAFVEKGFAWLVRSQPEGQLLAELVRNLDGILPAAQARYRFQAAAEMLEVLHGKDEPIYLDGFALNQVFLKPADVVALDHYDLRRFFPLEQHPGLLAAVPHAEPLPPEVRAWLVQRFPHDNPRLRADLWSLGALAYWLLTGQDVGVEPGDLAAGREDLDDDFRSVVERCMGWGEQAPFASVADILRWLSGDTQYEIVLPAEASLRPTGLEFTNVGREGVAASMFNLVNLGGGLLKGTLETSVPWLRVSPSTFEDNELTAQVWFDPQKLGPVTKAEGEVRVHSNGGELTLPVEVNFVEARIKGAPVFLLSLIILVLASLPQALLLFLRSKVVRTMVEGEALRLELTTQSNKLFDYAHQLQHYILADFALIALIPLVCWWTVRGLNHYDRKPLVPALCIALMLPALVTPLYFVTHPVHLSFPAQNAALKFLDPFYASVPRGIFALITTLGLVVDPQRYPQRWAESSELRTATWIVLGMAFLQAMRTYAW